MQAKDIMKPAKSMNVGAVHINQDESIDNAALFMKDKKVDKVAVVDDSGEVVGMITREVLIQNSDELNEDFFID